MRTRTWTYLAQKNFIEDYQSGVPVTEIMEKYGYKNANMVYQRVLWLKSRGYQFTKNRVVEKRKKRCKI